MLPFWQHISSSTYQLHVVSNQINLRTRLFVGNACMFETVCHLFKQNVCTAIAAILHYLFLDAFFLMLAEGCLITHMVVTPLHQKNLAPLLIALAFGNFV